MYAAISLGPETKLQYFEIKWKDNPGWITNATNAAKTLWQTNYRTTTYTDPSSPHHASPGVLSARATIGGSNEDTVVVSRWKQKKRARLNTTDGDQFDGFQVTEEEEEVPDILRYWAERLSNPWWSQLAYMALKIHSIPAMSAEVERLFCR